MFDADNFKLGEYLVRWLADSVRDTVHPTTFERYEQLVRLHIRPVLGKVKLKNLTSAHVRGLYREKLDAGLSPRTVHYIHVTLHKALKQAIADGLIPRNVTEAVNPPQVRREEMRPLMKVEGPVTTTIPTIRNKLDAQLQSRMLTSELEDYEGRVAKHSSKVSELLLPDFATEDFSPRIRAWKAALGSLTGIRRVVFPLTHEQFRFDRDDVSHGARLWANILGLMCANVWLEQRNRDVIELPSGEKAVVAIPRDYAIAYGIFKATCERSVVNLSDTHRRILDAVYQLHQEDEHRDFFRDNSWSQREIERRTGVPQSTISAQKSYLVRSLKLLVEGYDGKLRLADDANPSWWRKDDALDGLPKPKQVWAWWNGEDDPPDPGTPGRPGHLPRSPQIALVAG